MKLSLDIKADHHAALLDLAARRGVGVSEIVADALELYFQEELQRRRRVQRAVASLGSLSDDEADTLRAELEAVRRSPFRLPMSG